MRERTNTCLCEDSRKDAETPRKTFMTEKLAMFERAFRDGTAGCRRTCECGKEYYDGVQTYDWEEGELERLEADTQAVGLDYTPGDITIEGRTYVDACTCWHKRAERIMAFIDGHGHKIASYLTLEKRRKQDAANEAPTVG